jgi:endonuclease YncB( thermonuclease family)
MKILVLLLATLARGADDAAALPPPASAVVVRVYDGDTFTLEGGEHVRLRSVNTTELRPKEAFGEEARSATVALLLGKTVDLSYGQVLRDGYGRLVAGASVGGRSLELELLRKGLGHVFLLPPVDGDVAPLLQAQREARTARLGLWSDPHFQGLLHITSFHANGRGDERQDPNTEYARVCNIGDAPLNLAGYRITNLKGRSFVLPDVIVPPGHTFEVHSGMGKDQRDPARQLTVHLMSRVPVWNNKADRITILDPQGRVVDFRDHTVQGDG